MKKLFVLLLMVFVLFALVACGGDNDADTPPAVEQNTPTPSSTPTTQDETPVANEAENGEVELLSEDYYTFGDVIVLMSQVGMDEYEERFEIIIHDFVIVEPIYCVEEHIARFWGREGLADMLQDIREVVVFSVTITNICDSSTQHGGVQIWGPTGERQKNDLVMARGQICYLMTGPDTRHDSLHAFHPVRRIQPGETFEGYIYAIYEGDGDYWVRMAVFGPGVYARLPVSR